MANILLYYAHYFCHPHSFSGVALCLLLFALAPQVVPVVKTIEDCISNCYIGLGHFCFIYPRTSLFIFHAIPLLLLNLCWGGGSTSFPLPVTELNELTQTESFVKETFALTDSKITDRNIPVNKTENYSVLGYIGIAVGCILVIGLVLYLGSSSPTPPGSGGQNPISDSSSSVLDSSINGSGSSFVNPVIYPINSPVIYPGDGMDSLMLQSSLAPYASSAGITFFAGTLFTAEFVANTVAPLLREELRDDPSRALILFEGDNSMFYEEVGQLYPNFFRNPGQENAFFYLVHTILYGLNHLLDNESLQGRDLYYHLRQMFVRDPLFLPTMQQIEMIIRYLPLNSEEYPLEVDNVLLLPLLLAIYEGLLLLLTNPSIIQQVTVGIDVDDLGEVHFESDEEEGEETS